MYKELLHHLTHRPTDANKYDFGHVLVFGGSAGMVGAPLLSGEAALRIGAGLVTIASDAQTVSKLEGRVEEIMTFSLLGSDERQKIEALLTFMHDRRVKVTILGPGLKPEAALFVRRITPKFFTPLIIDAGGLAAFNGQPSLLQEVTAKNPNVIITPHTGEFAKLTNTQPSRDPSLLQHLAEQYAKQYAVTVVLKGPHTIVAHPDGTSHLNTTGNPGLATAGTGDVLAGIIGGLLAQDMTVAQAAEVGVYLHGLAGDLATSRKTEPGVIASDLVELLPEVLKKFA